MKHLRDASVTEQSYWRNSAVITDGVAGRSWFLFCMQYQIYERVEELE